MMLVVGGREKGGAEVCCMYMSLWMDVSVCAHAEVRALHLRSCSITLHLVVFKTRCLCEQEAHCLGWVGWPVSPQDLPVGNASLFPSVL